MEAPAHAIVLLRHGETEWSRESRHTGRTDVPLTDRGRHEARAAGERLRGMGFTRVITSPLSRARETAALAGFGAGAETDEALLEWDYGAYEGRTTPEIRAERAGWLLWRDGCPDGEQPGDIGARVDPLVTRARDGEGLWLLVAHGHVLRVLTARWLDLEAGGGASFALGTAAISVLGFEREVPVIQRWNETGELP